MLDASILIEFRQESKGILEELAEIIESLEEATSGEFPAAELEQFAQKIDRIMGAAQTFALLDPQNVGLQRIGSIAQICKHLGYKASEYKTVALVPLFAAFWADTLEVIEELVNSLENTEKTNEVVLSFAPVLQNRLNWLAEKVRASGKGGEADLKSQMEIDKLLAEFRK